jgi:hypothetical protein
MHTPGEYRIELGDWLEQPNPDPKWTRGEVAIVAHLRRNTDGLVRQYSTCAYFFEGDQTTPSTWPWSDGNDSCDCNRRIYFALAAGLPTEDLLEIPCTGGDYAVNQENPKTGKIFYREFD